MLLKEKESELDPFYDLRKLTDFAVEYRYELIFDEEPLDRKNILNRVESFYKLVFEKVKNTV